MCLECQGHHICQLSPYWLDKNQVKFMNISTQHILQCKLSEPLADASGRKVDLMNENGIEPAPQLLVVANARLI